MTVARTLVFAASRLFATLAPGRQLDSPKRRECVRHDKCALTRRSLTVAALLLAGCAKPAQLDADLRLTRPQNGSGKLYLRIVNEDNRVTTPIQVELRIRRHDGAAPVNVLPIAPFVLNRHETREITAVYHSDAADLDPKLIVREGETGRVLQPKMGISYVAASDLIPAKRR